MEDKISVSQALCQVYKTLCLLTVQGPDNAKILASACDDLKTIIEVIERGGEDSDTSEDVSGNV